MPQFQYKLQDFQTTAVNSVADMFNGIDIGFFHRQSEFNLVGRGEISTTYGGNINPATYLMEKPRIDLLNQNLRKIQKDNKIRISGDIDLSERGLVLDTQMETGTGKTYTFIKTMFELNERYGLTHFIIIVPSIAIKEGTKKAFEATQSHFEKEYGGQHAEVYEITPPRQNRGRTPLPGGVGEFIGSSGKGLTVLITTIQSFNSANNIINQQREDGVIPMEAIAARHPVLIIDEPQVVEGKQTLKYMSDFKPLFALRYSATFRTDQIKNPVYILDSHDAFRKNLVKNISVADYRIEAMDTEFIGVNKMSHNNVNLSAANTDGTLRHINTGIEGGGDGALFLATQNPAYQGLRVTEINQVNKSVTFSNEQTIRLGEYAGQNKANQNLIDEAMLHDMIQKHLAKEQFLFERGIKCLSLVFIDKVKHYRDYESDDSKGYLQGLFEKCYLQCVQKLRDGGSISENYDCYLSQWGASDVHGGYFSGDAKRNKKIDANGAERNSEEARTLQQEITNLILREKESVLQLDNKLRFIFAHSALREGWDNPNVFQICKLRTGYAATSIVQEVGRGLRICVNGELERQDVDTVGRNLFNEINRLDVFTLGNGEFIGKLQNELSERRSELNAAPIKISAEILIEEFGLSAILASKAIIDLHENGYIDEKGLLLHKSSIENILEKHGICVKKFFATFSAGQKPSVKDSRDDDNAPRTYTANLEHYKEFKHLWMLLHQKVIYEVRYSPDFVDSSAKKINGIESIVPLKIGVTDGKVGVQDGGFETSTHERALPQNKKLTSDIPLHVFLQNIADKTNLPRNTIIDILLKIDDTQYKNMQSNPFLAIEEVAKAINGVIYETIVDSITYRKMDGVRGSNTKITLEGVEFKATRYIDLKGRSPNNNLWGETAPYDSEDPEKDISEKSLSNEEIVVFAKLPRAVNIPSPLHPQGINPDFGFVLRKNGESRFYFVAEAKPTTDLDELRGAEERKVQFMEKYFDGINADLTNKVKFKVVSSYDQLLTFFNA